MGLRGVYFPGLNGLRFFAALAVIFTHVELMKKLIGFKNLWTDSSKIADSTTLSLIQNGKMHWASPLVAEAGPLGVVFFFVLSGFLITYLLLEEKKQTNTVAVRAFYLRRIYRIWPLYFFIFLLGFFVLPHFSFFHVRGQSEGLQENFMGNFWCYLFFLPNLAYSLYLAVPNIGQSWSIGVEEQFYVFWPVVMKFFKRTLLAIVICTVILLLIKATVLYMSKSIDAPWVIPLKKFVAMSKIECMTIGGLGAWLIFNRKEAWLKMLYSRWTQLTAFILIPALLYITPGQLQDGVYLVFAGCFLVIILNISGNPDSLLKLEKPIWNWLGKISYGIYMYHLLCVVFTIHLVKFLFEPEFEMTALENTLVYIISIVLTLLVAHVSYTYFEYKFIRMKKSVTRIISGEDAK